MMNDTSGNIASTLEQLAGEMPQATALIVPRKNKIAQLSFQELNEETNRLADGLRQLGIKKETRVLLMVPPGTEFISLTFALFKTGAVPVLIDPGLGKKNILNCIGEMEPEAMIAIPLAHAARKLYCKPFNKTKIFITVGRRWFWGGLTLDQIRNKGDKNFSCAPAQPDDPAAILFTSGSTGPPKGVLYTHQMFAKQVEIIRELYGIQKGEVDLPTFPLFALFGAALGMTCVIPDMDPTHPANVDPEKLTNSIKQFSVTNSFGSPALWNTVSQYCLEKNIQLPTLKRILMAGAPVPGSLLKRFDTILSTEGEIHTPYGATEALPVSSITRAEVLNETWKDTERGKGTCVGRTVEGINLKIIKIIDTPIPNWDASLEIPQGEVGEIVVSGPWVTREYFRKKETTQLAKIYDGETCWHRMGDVGYLDVQNRLWFCGRKNHRVVSTEKTYYSIPCEAIFNVHPDVKRSALVGIGPKCKQIPAIIIEPENKNRTATQQAKKLFTKELLELAGGNETTKDIQRILYHDSFPVDVRHNAKIGREELAQWAEERNNL